MHEQSFLQFTMILKMSFKEREEKTASHGNFIKMECSEDDCFKRFWNFYGMMCRQFI